MKKRIYAFLLATLLVSETLTASETESSISIDKTEKIKTTAYCMGTTTASGHPVRYGICAGQSWMCDQGNWIACVWTREGEFLGYFEVLDKGGTDAIKNGYVIDVYFPTYDECVEWMKKTNGKCLVQYVQAEG